MPDHPCREADCVGLASRKGGQCAPHAQGYRRRPKHGADLRCANCRHLIARESWYRVVDGALHCLRDCTPHPKVQAARDLAARQAAPAKAAR